MRVVSASPKAQSFCMASTTTFVAFVFALLLVRHLIRKEGEGDAMVISKGNRTVILSRKLMQSANDGDINRTGTGCSMEDIEIYQGQVEPLPSGIPSYTVEITNLCSSDCSIGNIHFRCGWFSSACLINPRVFRRLHYDDCLVNDGKALPPATILSFKYANTYRYPLSVSSVEFECSSS